MAKKNCFHKSSSEQAIGAYNEKEYLNGNDEDEDILRIIPSIL